jgi:two-component system, chemotaxis family, CheB/CheR fusion protein
MSVPNSKLDLDLLLDYLKRNRGFDFTGYKRATLSRRITRRMEGLGVDKYLDYLDYLEVHPEEFTLLFNTILINVTSFFREKEAWEFLAKNLIPKIIQEKGPGQPIRIWSAGCASGEEPYTAAMLLADALGEEEFHQRVKIYATDIDEEALAKARLGIYTCSEIEMVPESYQARFFQSADDHFVFRKDLRRSVIFGRHDLIQDAPISKIDLLICRNILMYLNAETQAKVLARLHFALNEGGYLFLGRAEMLLTHTNLFTPVELKERIFSRTPKINLRDQILAIPQSGNEEAVSSLVRQIRSRDIAFDTSPFGQLLIDPNGRLLLANEKARQLFGLSISDLGRFFKDLEFTQQPVEFRSIVKQALGSRNSTILKDIPWQVENKEICYLEIQVNPLIENSGPLLGASIVLVDVTLQKQLKEKLELANQKLETAFQELQSINEEIETTNEELQSAVEELETTNEELQSTNEELETTNEELQSTNEELETMNEEMRVRTEELNQTNAFMEAILSSLHGSVIVLNRDFHVQIWNKHAEELWGMRLNEVEGQNFFSLDVGLPLEQLRKPIRSVMDGEISHFDTQVAATNRRGRSIQCSVSISRMAQNGSDGVKGIIIVIEEIP